MEETMTPQEKQKERQKLQRLLAAALSAGDAQEAARLVGQGADPLGKCKTQAGTMPALEYALYMGDEACARALMSGGMELSEYKGDPLYFPCCRGSAGLVKFLLEKGADPSRRISETQGALQAAAELGHLEALALLLDAGADPNALDASGSSALNWALCAGQNEAAIYLFGRGADPCREEGGRSMLCHAARDKDCAPALAYFLGAGCDPNPDRLLHAAISCGNLAGAAALAESGKVDWQARDEQGRTALEFAKLWRPGEISEMLEAIAEKRGLSETLPKGNIGARLGL